MKIEIGDITKVRDVDVIVNSANGIGVMGAGVAGALAHSGGDLLRDAARQAYLDHGKPFEEGEVYVSDAGLLKRRNVKQIYHAVVMKFPGGPTSIDTIAKTLTATMNRAMKEGVKSIAIPGMGTGIGCLDRGQVARRMAKILNGYDGSIEITVVDMNEEFITAFQNALIVKTSEESDSVV